MNPRPSREVLDFAGAPALLMEANRSSREWRKAMRCSPKSGAAAPHSKTLARRRARLVSPRGFGMHWQSQSFVTNDSVLFVCSCDFDPCSCVVKFRPQRFPLPPGRAALKLGPKLSLGTKFNH